MGILNDCRYHLFSGRYKSLVVDGSGDGYLRTVCDYAHLNPVRAKLLTREQPLSDYRWSSYREYLRPPGERPGLKEQLLEQMGTELGRHHGGPEKRETDAQKAERIVGSELRKRHWTELDLKARRKSDARKVKLALRLRRETVMTLDWIAQRLHMGCRDTLANCLKAAKFRQ